MFDLASTIAPASLIFFDEERVFVRHEALERQRPVGALQADRLVVVFDDRRDAVERPRQPLRANRGRARRPRRARRD